MKTLAFAAAIGAAALGTAAPAHAEAEAQGWEFIVTPYFLLPNANGKFGLGPVDGKVSSTPADLFRDLNWAVLGSIEVNNGNWGVNFDVNYVNVDVAEGDVRALRLTGHQAAYTATLLKRIDEHAWVYAGARLSDFGLRLRCDSNCRPGDAGRNPPLLNGVDVARNKSWVEPLLGFRAELPFNDSLDLTFNADVGGFGIGSEVSVNAWPQLGIRLGRKSKALLGYRIIYVKHESGEGPSRFLYDAVTFGPTVGVEFRF